MTERFLQGLCDLKCGKEDDCKIDWNEEGCDRFNQKHKQVVGGSMPSCCLKVCGNCEYFTVAEFELYPPQVAGEEIIVGRIK